jgi:phage-related protein
MVRRVAFYRNAEGKCPVEEFLDSLEAKAAQKVTWVLKLLEDLPMVPSGYFKRLSGTDGLWECRVTFGSNAYRLLCFFAGNSVVVLTHGFAKKSAKTPAHEISRAESMKRDYLQRSKNHE